MSEPIIETPAAPSPEIAAIPEAPKSAAVVTPVPPELQPKPKETPVNPKVASEKLIDSAGKEAEKPDVVNLPAVPEKYEITPVEGMTLDTELLENVSPILKEAGLSNEQANKLAPVVSKIQEKTIAAYKAEQEKLDTQRDADEQKASKEVLGAKLNETLASVAIARDRLFSKESREILSKYGNNINLIKDLAWLGEQIREEKHVEGKPAAQGKNAADVMFPTMVKK